MPGKVVGTMVVCLSCKQVVWAHDSDQGDVRGILNMMRMPCRLCGNRTGNYDGWSIKEATITRLKAVDAWDAMHKVAAENDYAWANSPTCEWFVQ